MSFTDGRCVFIFTRGIRAAHACDVITCQYSSRYCYKHYIVTNHTSLNRIIPDEKTELVIEKHAGKSCTCSLCLEDIANECEIYMLPCKHEFHVMKCMNNKNIVDWLNEHRTCPYCRTSIRII